MTQPEDVAMASIHWVAALTARPAIKGVITAAEANEIVAHAAAQCRAAGSENAAHLIETMVPTSKGVDPVEPMKKQGLSIFLMR
jgi:hypothetical protein